MHIKIIYNIKLIEENVLLIEKTTFKYVFILLILKNFLLTQPNMFFLFFRIKFVF